MIEIRMIPRKGRGVVATKRIDTGGLFELSPVAVFPAHERTVVNTTVIFEHFFVRPDEYWRSWHVPWYVVFGFTSLSNHADQPNAVVEWVEEATGLWTQSRALRTIEPGDEVTVSYANINEYVNACDFV